MKKRMKKDSRKKIKTRREGTEERMKKVKKS